MAIRKFESKIPELGNLVFIDPTALVIGDVAIGDDSGVWPHTLIRGDINSITIGKRTNIQDGSIIHVTHDSRFYPGGAKTIIGDDITIGHRVTLHGCTIHNRCLIGMGSIILDHAVLEEEVLVGAGSLVPANKVLESGYLWMGSPVKKIRALNAQEKEFLSYSATHYVALKNRHMQALETS